MSDKKTCCHCGRELPVSEFWRRSDSKDGFSYRCKECARPSLHKNKERETDERRAWKWANAERLNREEGEKKKQNREHANEVHSEWVSNPVNRERVRAHNRLAKAIRAGKITRPKTVCPKCGRDVKLHGFLLDSSDFSKVTWLCCRCGAKAQGRTKHQLYEKTGVMFE